MELSIVMPCLNEAETLATCIRKARAFLVAHTIAGEIVVGDNGSLDGSQDIARREGARVVHVPVRGYGAALYQASRAAAGRYIIMGDSDDSYDFTALLPLVDKLRAGFDLVMGNRFQGGIRPGAMPWKNRYLGNPFLSAIGRAFFRSPARDFHCGLRGYSAEAFRTMDLRTTGMEFASEMVIKATLLKLRITEVPVTLSPDGRSRRPHLRPWRDGWRHLRFMLLYSPRWLFLYPGLALVLFGLIAGALLLRGPLRVGSVSFDVHTLAYAAGAISLGFQSIVFAFFTKIFAIQEGLLPEDPRLTRAFRYVTLEIGLVVGLLFGIFGLWASVAAVADWQRQGFGSLSPTAMLRRVIPAILGLTVGTQIVLSSFFFSILGLRVRRLPSERV